VQQSKKKRREEAIIEGIHVVGVAYNDEHNILMVMKGLMGDVNGRAQNGMFLVMPP